MAITATFKQECPTCGASVKIDDKMIGKKVECTKCKDKFVAEKPADADEEAPRKKKKAAAGKKGGEEDDDLVEPDEDPAPQVKSPKGNAGANGKAKHRGDDEDEPEAKGKAKKSGNPNKLTISLILAVVGVLLLGLVLFLLLKPGGGGRTNNNPVRPKGDGGTKPGDDGGGKNPSVVTPGDTPKAESNVAPLTDAEIAKLSNLLPNDTQNVFHIFAKDLWGPSGPLHEALFKTPGALNDFALKSKLGFSLAAVDDVICAEHYSQPSWKYTVIHFNEPLNEGKLKAALGLKMAVPIKGQTYYEMTETHPVFEVLSRFSFGIPNWYYSLEPRRPDRSAFVRLYDKQTLIVGDKAPVMALLDEHGEFRLQTPRSTPAAVLPANPTPMPGVEDKDKPAPKVGPGPSPGQGPGPGPGKMKPVPAPKGRPKIGELRDPSPLYRPGFDRAGAPTMESDAAPFAFLRSGPGTGLQTLASQAPADPNQPPPSAPKTGNMVTRDDMYLTIRPALKAILDRVEARKADTTDKVLISSMTDMEKARIETSLPEFRDRVVRRPRQFWDITVLLNEPTPRIQTLGTSVIQHADARFQLRNEIACGQDADAAAIKKEIMDKTSFTVAQFLKNLVNHEVRLPELPKKELPKEQPKLPPAGPPGKGKVKVEPKKVAPVVTLSSQMSVNQDKTTVDFVLDLVLDNAALTQLNSIAVLTASASRAETEAAASKSIRHTLGRAGKTVAEKGMSDRDVPPGRFPPGAFPRAKTPFHVDQEPRNRISWMAGLLPYLGQQHLYNRLQFDRSWRDPSNWMAGNTIVPQFLDPNYPDYLRRVPIGGLPLDFGATHYVGVAGIGLDAASYNRDDPGTVTKRGVFSNDGSATLAEIQKGRGASNIMVMIQVPYDGLTGVSPWIAGGGATLRGVPEKNSIAPFILSRDKNGKPIEHQGKRGTFVVMADGSVRFVDQNVSDDVFKAMATVQGPAPENFNLGTNPSTPLVPAPDKDDLPPTPTPEKASPTAAFVVPGKFSIDTPVGFAWGFSQDVKMDGRSSKVFECTKPGAKAKIVLEMEEKKLDTDEQKRSLITKDLDKNLGEMKKAGITVTEDIKPNLQSPISSRTEFRYTCKLPDGSALILHGKIIFGRGIYAVTAFATSAGDAKALTPSIDSFKELSPISGKSGTAQPPARHQGEGRVADADRGFSIVPPKGWQRNTEINVPGPVQPFMFFLGPKDAFTPLVNILQIPDDATPIENLGTPLKKAFEAAGQTVTDEGFVTIDGKKSYRISFKGTLPVDGKNVDSAKVQYFVRGGGNRIFIMTFAAGPDSFAALRKTFEESALSARVD